MCFFLHRVDIIIDIYYNYSIEINATGVAIKSRIFGRIMIAEIKIWTEYGKEYFSGVNFIPGTEAQEHFVFAHSAQDALEWFKKYPLFADAIVDDMQDFEKSSRDLSRSHASCLLWIRELV